MVTITEVEKSVSESVSKLKENAEGEDASVRGSVVDELSEVKSQIQEIRDRQHKLLEKNRELRQEISTDSGEGGEVNKALERQKKLRDDFMDLKDELNSLELKTDQIPNDYEFEDLVQEFRDKTDELEEIMPVVENAFENAQRAREETINEDDLTEVSADLRSDLVSEEQFSEMSEAISGLKDSIGELNNNIARTRLDEAIDVASIKQKIEKLQDEAGELDAEELEERLRKIEISQDIIESELEEEILESQEQLETSIYSLASSKADSGEVKELGEEIGKTKLRAGRKINDLQSEIRALEMRIKELSIDEKVDTAELEEEIERARDEIAITLLETLRGMEAETASSSDMRKAQARLEELENVADDLGSSVEEISERLSKVEMDEVVERSELESKAEEIRQQTASTNELRGVHESLEMVRDRTQSLRDEVRSLEVEEKVDREELEEKIQKSQDEVTMSVMDTVEHLKQELATKNELRGVHETLGLFNDRHDKMKDYIDATEKDLSELEEDTDSRIEAIYGRIDDLGSDMEERTEELGSMIDEVDQRLEREEIEEKVDRAELETAMEELRDEMSSIDAEEVAELEARMEDMSALMLEMVRKFSAE